MFDIIFVRHQWLKTLTICSLNVKIIIFLAFEQLKFLGEDVGSAVVEVSSSGVTINDQRKKDLTFMWTYKWTDQTSKGIESFKLSFKLFSCTSGVAEVHLNSKCQLLNQSTRQKQIKNSICKVTACIQILIWSRFDLQYWVK